MMADEGITQLVFKEKRIQHTAALCFGLVCVVIGLPLWWKTTEIYRVSLPYSDIQHLSDTKIEYVTQVEVIWAVNKDVSSGFLTNLAIQLNKQLEQREASSLVSIFEAAVRKAETDEVAALKNVKTVNDLKQIAVTDSLTKYSVVITDKPQNQISHPVLGLNNNIFLPFNGADESGLAAQICQLLKDVMRESAVVKSLEAAQGLRKQRPDKSSMRSFRFHPGYDVTLTLMVPEPDKVRAHWDVETGIEDYLDPLTSSLAEYINVTVSSQVLYFIGIGGRPKKGDGHYYLTEQDLPHIINPLESKLGSHASTNPGMNFIVYIPTVDKRPLYIHDKKGVPLPSNAFLSPRWGGVMIYNTESTQEDTSVSVDMHRVMEVFISEMRLLLNLNAQMVTEELEILQTGSAKLRQWELSAWLRCRCVENLTAATRTLQSLAQLLEEIGNIVITDDIGKEVESAVLSIKESQRFLRMGDLHSAFLASRAAFEASELAFFHPSLLELLYFPEDQKFAIYIPLFLPISIPILTSIAQAIKFFRRPPKVKSD